MERPGLLTALRARPELADVATDEQADGQQLVLTIDRQAAARFGVTLAGIDQTLYDAFGQRQIATVYAAAEQYHVVMEVDPVFRRDPGVLDKLFVTASAAQTSIGNDLSAGIGAGSIRPARPCRYRPSLRMERGNAPLLITHQGLFPATTLSFLDLAPNVSPRCRWRRCTRPKLRLGASPTASPQTWSASAAAFTDPLSSEPVLIPAAIVTGSHIVLGVRTRVSSTLITILSTPRPRPVSARCWR